MPLSTEVDPLARAGRARAKFVFSRALAPAAARTDERERLRRRTYARGSLSVASQPTLRVWRESSRPAAPQQRLLS